MFLPSMVRRSGDTLIVQSVVSGQELYAAAAADNGGNCKNPSSEPFLEQSDCKVNSQEFDISSTEDPKKENKESVLPDLPDCKVKRNYSCSSCEYFTKNPRNFLYHLRDVHNEKVRIYECPNCLYASKHFQKLLRHSRMVHGNSTANKKTIEAKMKQQNQLQHHPVTAEEETESDTISENEEVEAEAAEPINRQIFKCSVCGFTAKSQVSLNKHEREEHIKTKFFRCTKCTYVTHMKARFTKHVKYHSMPMIKCDTCDFRTPYKWNLDRHCKNHNGKGAFKCSACNFTADIKQSLTVHEMNHHVPPVGQAAGFGIGRRRNKVGASDSVAAEEAATAALQNNQVIQNDSGAPAVADAEADKSSIKLKKKSASVKKTTSTKNLYASNSEPSPFGSDFINPDDIVHHANGNVYFKNKCKLCNFKSAWDSEMTKHEAKVHQIVKKDETINANNVAAAKSKKTQRPVPNLIPISKIRSGLSCATEPMMSQKDFNEICAKSTNSALKDFASLMDVDENIFKNLSTNNNISRVPDLIPAASYLNSSAPKSENKNINNNNNSLFKQKNASFFDQLKEKLMNNNFDDVNLHCEFCGHNSKCLSEQVKHQKSCNVGNNPNYANRNNNNISNIFTSISSSRCQYCRQRCKSSVDLFNHLQTCAEAKKTKVNSHFDDAAHQLAKPLQHPMENRVFVWNNIEVPMDLDVDDSIYEYTEDKSLNQEDEKDNMSLDLSIRTQSPESSEHSFHQHESQMPIIQNSPSSSVVVQKTSSPEKIPTHGTDISVAQHKRVFQCPHCTFWASTASRFHVHIVGHLNKKPFECSLCSYRSNWRWDITKHIKLKSVRDPAHESAKVLMTDETGRRNYTKYNKYLTEIHVSVDQSLDTSGGSGTRPKGGSGGSCGANNNNNNNGSGKSSENCAKTPTITADFNSVLKSANALKGVESTEFGGGGGGRKRSGTESKRTLFKCKKCNFRDASRDVLLQHVKGHYYSGSVGVSPGGAAPAVGGGGGGGSSGVLDMKWATSSSSSSEIVEKDEASVTHTSTSTPPTNNNMVKSTTSTTATFRCGHCNQVSNWKHVIQRHCRLKHGGDIRVVSNKNGQEKLEIEEQTDEPDHVDVVQTGTFKCKSCPFSNDDTAEFEEHLEGHISHQNAAEIKCHYCNFYVSKKEELYKHLQLHGVANPEDFLQRLTERSVEDVAKKFHCLVCPYVTNSKSQYTYHKQFHKPRGGQYSCSQCSYNVSKRHLLHQHLKVHGIQVTPHRQNGEAIDMDEIAEEIEEVPSSNSSTPTPIDSMQTFVDIPLVWVSKNGKFTKMYKCRFCPHVNLRKVNIQEHEKMHSIREKNANSKNGNEVEHHCNECNYVCNNAGVLSSHSKVHQGLSGTVHCLVDPSKSDEEQIGELTRIFNQNPSQSDEFDADIDLSIPAYDESFDSSCQLLHFCSDCPARFLKENEYLIHTRFHGVRLFYKCEYCSYTSRQKPHLLAHNQIHMTEYQERTKVLQNLHATNQKYLQPQIIQVTPNRSEAVWIVKKAMHAESIEDSLKPMPSSSSKRSLNVPLSGTDLFQQKCAATIVENSKLQENISPIPVSVAVKSDPQFGTLMHGNPNFIYPTTVKNGKTKEKRYKCPKCPSAFEKREQYKIHLGLHGSRQRYKCDSCDYSVKYYANYVQHKKKHTMNELAQKHQEELDEDDVEMPYSEELDNIEALNETIEPIEAQQQSSCSTIKEHLKDEKELVYCHLCPYANYRKDAVENHLLRHISHSGIPNNHTCEICDYSVPQINFLKDHLKLHTDLVVDDVVPDEDDVKIEHNDDVESENEDVDEESERFNNNEGEKEYLVKNEN